LWVLESMPFHLRGSMISFFTLWISIGGVVGRHAKPFIFVVNRLVLSSTPRETGQADHATRFHWAFVSSFRPFSLLLFRLFPNLPVGWSPKNDMLMPKRHFDEFDPNLSQIQSFNRKSRTSGKLAMLRWSSPKA